MHRAHRCTLADTVWVPTSANRTPALRRRPLPGRPPCRPPSLSSRCGGPRSLAGKNRAVCIPFSPNARKRPPSWQHPPEMHALRDQDGNILAPCIHSRAQSGDLGYMARESCQSQLILDAWRRYVARKGRFSRPRHLLGYMKRKTCHGLPPGNAPGRNIAIARHPRTHRGVTEPGDATRTKHRPIQHHALTRPRNHENILVPSAKKRR